MRESNKKRILRPMDNKINLPFDVAVDRLLAAKPKKKPIKQRTKKKAT